MAVKKKPAGGPGTAPVSAGVIDSISGRVDIPATAFPDSAVYVGVKNTLGSAPYVGPIFRVDQFGHFLENVWAKVTMNAAKPTDMRIVVPMNYRDTTDGALYDPSASFRATITYYPDHSFYVDESGNPVLVPMYLVEIS